MIPQNVLSTTVIPAPFLDPDDRPWNALVDYEYGGEDINDASGGLRVKIWEFRLVGNDVIAFAPGVAPTTLFTRSGITELSGCFDQNMNPCVGFVQNGQMVLWWFDSVPSAQVFTNLSGHSPRVCMDDKRASQLEANDIILSYIENETLYFRAQRGRFLTAYPLASVSTNSMKRVGMNTVGRLQWEFGEPAEIIVVPTFALNGNLPNGTVGQPYSALLTPTGGTLPYVSAAVTAGPTGLVAALFGSFVAVSGPPTQPWANDVTVAVTDNDGVVATLTQAVTIQAASAAGHRYWRVKINSTQRDFPVWPNAAVPHLGLSAVWLDETNLCTGGTAIASAFNPGHVAASAFDVDGAGAPILTTAWEAPRNPADPPWIGYVTPTPINPKALYMISGEGADNTYQFPFSVTVQSSDDGVIWQFVADLDGGDLFANTVHWFGGWA